MSVLAVIPARGGSKRLPGKNLRLLGGKSLLHWAIEAAWAATSIDKIVVSTEDREIEQAAYGVLFGLVGPNPVSGARKTVDVMRRPLDLAQDHTPMLAVMQHVLEAANYPDILVCLQPTTPFRPLTLIADVIAALEDAKADSALTVHQGRPTGEVYVTRRHLLLAGRMLGGVCLDYERPSQGINIDTEYDLVLAERACASVMIHGRPHDTKMAADHGVLSWPPRPPRGCAR